VIAIIDYKAGNLASVKKAFEYLRAECVVTADPETVKHADKVVLPGVGHFAATAELDRSGLRAAIQECIEGGRPFLGICVGMQWMLNGSSEAPEARGLGAISGVCERFQSAGLKVPHVGWNRIAKIRSSLLLEGIPSASFVYYSHSYCAPIGAETVATTEYGGEYSSTIERGNLFGVQFHPEKSGEAGLKLLRNFMEL
jgi:imidazole glycerol-phosphate synthase subunit HisH